MKSNLKLSNDSGIYCITCNANGKFYIGSAANLYKRWDRHLCDLRHNKHDNRHLQNAWNKYGESAFTVSVLEKCHRDTLKAREQYYLDTWQPFDEHGFNISRSTDAPLRGGKRTPEHVAKVAAAHIGRKRSPEACANISAGMKGMKRSPESCAKQSETITGRKRPPFSPEHMANLKTSIQAANSKSYFVTSPDGKQFEIRNMVQFCKEYGLSHQSMYSVARGRTNHHKGWKVQRVENK